MVSTVLNLGSYGGRRVRVHYVCLCQLCLLKRTLLVDESSGTSSEAESEADGDIEEQETRPKKKGGKNQAGKNQTAAGNKSASATTGMGTSIKFM